MAIPVCTSASVPSRLSMRRPCHQTSQTSRAYLELRRPSSRWKVHRRCRAEAPQAPIAGNTSETDSPTTSTTPAPGDSTVDVTKEVSKFARGAATTFAPRASGAVKNPAYKGSLLYTIFEVQAWASLVVGGLLSFNILFPSDEPDIARLMGMWSVWMFTVPSLRARDCSAAEKDALNILFLLIPIINVALPFVWKSFSFIFMADCVTLAVVFAWKMGLPALQSEPPAGSSDS